VSTVPCRHDVGRLQVANGGDGLQLWKVAAHIFNNQWRIADNGWSFSLGVERGANKSSAWKFNSFTKHCTKSHTATDPSAEDITVVKWIDLAQDRDK
jgi:hypothetical protein